MMTTYPFALPEFLRDQLPASCKDGNHYLDVRVGGKWDGILVVNDAGMCIGIYVRCRVEEYPLPFAVNEIELIRQASLWNRILAAVPFDLWLGSVLAILAFSPITLLLGFFVSPFIALFSLAACAIAIYIMYSDRGFPLIRFPVAVLGLGQIISGCGLLLRLLS